MRNFISTICLMITSFGLVIAQENLKNDTLKLSITDAENIFLKNNLLLLAQKYNLDMAKAAIIQAKLWDNPTVSIEQSAYNQYTKQILPISFKTDASFNPYGANPASFSKGQSAVQVQQLFLMAGKRNKRIKLEQINYEMAEFEMYDLMRTLKYELRTTFFNVYFFQQNINVIEQQTNTVNSTLKGFEKQYALGNIPLKELVRLKSFLLELENEKLDLQKQLIENSNTILFMLRDSTSKAFSSIVEKDKVKNVDLSSLKMATLIDESNKNRYDLKLYDSKLRYNEQNLSYQKSLAVPDLRLGGIYDRSGSYIVNYSAITLQMDIPLLNRNQGNIKVAQSQMEQDKLMGESFKQRVQLDISKSLQMCLQTQQLYKKYDQSFTDDLNKVMQAINDNYNKRNLSLIEYIDFFQSYKQNINQNYQLQNNLINSLEELNYQVGKTIINY